MHPFVAMLGGSDAESSASELKAKRQVKGRGSALVKMARSSKSSVDLLGAALEQALGEDALSGDEDSSTSSASVMKGARPYPILSLREIVAARREKKRKAAAQIEGTGDVARRLTRPKITLDLGSDEHLDRAKLKEWELKLSESKDKDSDDLKTAFSFGLVPPNVDAVPASLWTEDGKVNMDAVLAWYVKTSKISPQEPLEFTNDDSAYLLWLIRQAKALQLTTDSEVVSGRAVLVRRQPIKRFRF